MLFSNWKDCFNFFFEHESTQDEAIRVVHFLLCPNDLTRVIKVVEILCLDGDMIEGDIFDVDYEVIENEEFNHNYVLTNENNQKEVYKSKSFGVWSYRKFEPMDARFDISY